MGHKFNAILFVFILVLTACNFGSGAPQSWIDQPLERLNPYALQTFILQAHASDANGVAKLEFSVDGDVTNTVDMDGGRLEMAMAEWTPTEPGTYTISVRATDSQGNTGEPASVEIIILGDAELAALKALQAEQEPEQPVANAEEEQEEEEEEEEIQVAQEPPEDNEQVPQAPAGPAAVALQNSNCRQGPGTAYEIEGFLLKDQQAPIVGRLSDNSWLVISIPNEPYCWVASNLVNILGVLSAVSIVQAPPPPVVEQPPEESSDESSDGGSGGQPPAADTTLPNIASVNISPSTIYKNACEFYDHTSVVTIKATDNVGIDYVQGGWSIGGESGTITFTAIGGNKYQGTAGPTSATGTMNIYGSAVDTSGNFTPFIRSVTVLNCGG
jgi:uncharacterized protein YraI